MKKVASACALLAAAVVLHARGTTPILDQQTFRAQTDLVVVDAAVLTHETPVTGLTAHDFQVRDNGVLQEAQLASVRAVPLDVSLVVDIGSINAADPLRFWDEVRSLNRQLRPGDRLGLTTFGSVVHDEVPLSPVPAEIPGHPIPTLGRSAVLDALAQAIMRPGVGGRRHVIVEMTHGEDLMSVTSPAEARDVAKRSDAVIYVVLQIQPLGDPNPMLIEAARTTGGDVLEEKDVTRAFQKILASLQAGYVLTYSPKGVASGGWHTTTVTVMRAGNFTVRARPGYFGGS